MKTKIWVYKFNKSYPMEGYQAKTILDDHTYVYGYGRTQDDAISHLVDNIRAHYASSDSAEIYEISFDDYNWNYSEPGVVGT